MVSQYRKTAKDPSGSRASILDAATEAFMDHGFAGARVDQIAHRAKANKAMIYYHFGSKLGLYRAVLLHLFDDVLAEVERLKKSDAEPREKLRVLYSEIAGHFARRPALPHIMLREILAGGKSMDADVARTLIVIVSFVSETIQEGVRRGQFQKVHPLLLHISVLAPLLVHSAGSAFRERVLAREVPGGAVPASDDMLKHLLEGLDRSLAPDERGETLRSDSTKTSHTRKTS
jgi:TetR/AcrR family transcriptional regulator